jgi:hypothetical protein
MFRPKWSSSAVKSCGEKSTEAVAKKTRVITQQEGIHTYALGEPYTNIKTSTQKDSPHPQLLTPDDDHFGRNMS